MLTDNKEIFRNCFVIIYCHLTKVSSQINKRIIFEPNDNNYTIYSMVLVMEQMKCGSVGLDSFCRDILLHLWSQTRNRLS